MMSCGDRITRRRLLGGGVATFAGAGGCAPGPVGAYDALGRGLDNIVLTSSSGYQVQWRALTGAPRALFFGFTYCPVICPVTIYELTAAADRIGASADALRIDFITVDPVRDTPERMGAYFSGFGPKVTGFTGAEDALAQVRSAYEVTATRVPLERGGFTIDHTATVFLSNASGRVVDVLAYGSEPEVIDARLRTIVS